MPLTFHRKHFIPVTHTSETPVEFYACSSGPSLLLSERRTGNTDTPPLLPAHILPRAAGLPEGMMEFVNEPKLTKGPQTFLKRTYFFTCLMIASERAGRGGGTATRGRVCGMR